MIQRNKPERVIILSLDAMGAADLSLMLTLPHFGRLAKWGALCKKVYSVYPSLTYPAHTSIVTGKMPAHHGIINNTLLQPERERPDWFWQRKYVRGTTLYDEAIKQGKKTAALLWPVTAKSKIHYCLPEVLANRPWQNQIVASAVNSTFWYALDLQRRFGHMRQGIRQPFLDDFVTAAAVYTIEKHNPELFLIHLTDLDSMRHAYGRTHENCIRAMRRHDERLGKILSALEKTGDMEKTTVAVLGDHCQLDTHTVIYPNYLLRKMGYLCTENEKIKSWDFLAKHCDGACYIYKNPALSSEKTEGLTAEVTAMFQAMTQQGDSGIAKVFTKEEVERMGADENCVIMLEAMEGYYFLDDFEKMTGSVNEERKHPVKATHGYLPEKEGYETFFLAAGCGIRTHGGPECMYLWDEGPTLARLMGLSLGETDGKVIEELLL